MYQVRFYEDGRFVTDLGGYVRTLSEAISQIEKIGRGTDAQKLEDIVGVRWLRAGITPCHMLVVDEFGNFIKTAEIVRD